MVMTETLVLGRRNNIFNNGDMGHFPLRIETTALSFQFYNF